MRNVPLKLAILIITALCLRVAVAAPAQPMITISDDKTRVIARYGVVENFERQSKLAVKELSRLIKKYPDAKEWAVAYNTTPALWRVLEYDIENRELIAIALKATSKGRRWDYGYFPAHIHSAAQQSLTIEALWEINQLGREANGY